MADNPYDAAVDSVLGAANPYDAIVDQIVPQQPPDTSVQDKQRFDNGQMTPQESQAYQQKQFAASGGGFHAMSGAQAAGDLALSGLSNTVVGIPAKGIAGLAARATGNNPQDAYNFVDQHMIYHPQTNTGQAVVEQMGDALKKHLGPVADGLKAVDAWGNSVAGELGGHQGQQALQAAGNVSGQVTGTMADLASAVPGVAAARNMLGGAVDAARAAGLPQQLDRLQAFRNRGLMLRPSDVAGLTPGKTPSVLGRALEASVDSGVASQELSIANAPKFQAAGARSVGADLTETNGLFTPELIQELKAPENAIYSELASVPGNGAGQAYKEALGKIDTRGMSQKAADDVNKLKLDYAVLGDSQSAVNDVRVLRERSSKLIRSDSAEDNQVGFAMKKMADNIDDELAARAGKAVQLQQAAPDLIPRFQQARVQLAKVHTIEDSLRAGVIDPKEVWKSRKAGVPVNLDPDLKFIADAAEFAPGVSRHPQSFMTQTGTTVPHGKSGFLQGVTRNIGGRAILQGPYQNALGREGVNPLPSRVAPVRTGMPDPTAGMTTSPPTAPPPGPRGANSDLASVMAGDLTTGDYSGPQLTLGGDSGPTAKSANFSPSEADRLSSGLSLSTDHGRPAINIGMNIGDGKVKLSKGQIESVLKRTGVSPTSVSIKESGTEPTYVAHLDRPLTDREAFLVSTELRQDAIAQNVPGSGGALHGPKAADWGPYNPDYFLHPDATNLSDTAGVMSQGVPEDIVARSTRGYVPRMGDIIPLSPAAKRLLRKKP